MAEEASRGGGGDEADGGLDNRYGGGEQTTAGIVSRIEVKMTDKEVHM
jgi:hypothetical protein